MLARNLVASTVTPALVIDHEGVLSFFNEAAGELIGRRFVESGRLTREQWKEIGPLDDRGHPIAAEDPLTTLPLQGRPAVARLRRIKTDRGTLLEVRASAIPLVAGEVLHGTLVLFVAVSAEGEDVPRARPPAEQPG